MLASDVCLSKDEWLEIYADAVLDPNTYAKPDEFIPERWEEQPELIRDKSGFAPWSLGI
jgi:cytochrome P450